MKSKFATLSAAVVIVALALTSVGCSSSNDSSSDTLKFGLEAPLTGSLA